MSLKEMFEVPEYHSLLSTNYQEEGTTVHNGYWSYEERDESGRLISKIEYWDCTNPGSLPAKNGYRKYDSAGKLIVQKSL